MKKLFKNKAVFWPVVSGLAAGFALLGASVFFSIPAFNYSKGAGGTKAADTVKVPAKKVFVATHIKTPDKVRAVYMTACVAATPSLREKLVKLANDTEVNSIVIDIKDYTGTISFPSDNPALKGTEGGGCVARDMRDFIARLHGEDIYVIGRITVFQDPYYTKLRPDLAVKKADGVSVWKDYKGLSFIDVGAEDYWKYIVAVSKASHALGFDELNFDYIRFPSDGNMRNISFPFSGKQIEADPALGKAEVLRNFFAYLKGNLKSAGVVLSADLFGMTATNKDDLNIGQLLEYAIPYFDYISPMVYPSHYPRGFNGYKNVNAHPYDIVKFSMDEGVKRLIAASSTPLKLRPWLQDFNYPVVYTAEMVRAQKQAVYDAGLNSWMLWDPANRYTREALDKAR
ncbi:MAG: hypothetical protein GXP44_02830 [bacterium]|nr:hypothetical protein [bacterium]